ncbi:putative zinc finger protein [Micromonospora violae]|uniref:Putative zinc finger protein n=1 Tax=Micromonospora violae TaxID=1278207 RepID=A0A4Q7UF84_9ACTN|nr:zf-HC2 domain-containing protein [Micromonospora violae]RZT79464.1 putative zinc finger protein [Micromonospora violae]
MTDDGLEVMCDRCGPYLLGELPPDAVVDFEAHLLDCRRCQRECEELGPLISVMLGLGPDDVTEPPGGPPLTGRRRYPGRSLRPGVFRRLGRFCPGPGHPPQSRWLGHPDP